MYDTLQVTIEPRYNIHLGTTATILKPFDELLSRQAKHYVFLIDEHLPRSWLEKIFDECSIFARKTSVYPIIASESNKTREMKIVIENKMLEEGFSQETTLIALGGASILNLAGFIASSYCFGISCIYFPTTLASMLDMSIGGKLSLNTAWGKNLIGTHYHPRAVFINIDWLSTLDNNLFYEGILKSIHYSLISDAHFFLWTNAHLDALKKRDPLVLFELVKTGCSIKKAIVEKNQKIPGYQSVLNFGQTISVALEKAAEHQLSYGQTLALGMVAEAYLSQKVSQCPSFLEKLIYLLQKLELPTSLPIPLDENAFMQQLDFNQFILLKDIGLVWAETPKYTHTLPLELIREAFSFIAYQKGVDIKK